MYSALVSTQSTWELKPGTAQIGVPKLVECKEWNVECSECTIPGAVPSAPAVRGCAMEEINSVDGVFVVGEFLSWTPTAKCFWVLLPSAGQTVFPPPLGGGLPVGIGFFTFLYISIVFPFPTGNSGPFRR
eukprot:NODE_1026_length_514_cov_35.695090_g1016_i0.p1 GENE.NODE_1026_length_514_cov_35.695090_g1016_i0~~NODE_1026_length_514_cov_35.695090_g1016_i0.p1  ORF type:complete len:150 (+),score=20.39 NODE_1026_length_514_cov_35.695090_g1016_i0:63-452(+)